MPIKKSQLYSSIWEGCDKLRGGMDASQYKDYVLVLLFVKYVSDRYAGNPDALIEVPEGGSFQDMVALIGKTDIGDKINIIIRKLAEANDLRGIIDVADFNDPDKLGRGKEMQDRLSDLVKIFHNPDLDFSKNRAEGDDLLGDAYEYLMRNFATQSGKSKGQFDRSIDKLRIGTLRTSHGRKVENIDFELEPQFASILQTQMNELVTQYIDRSKPNSIKKVAETKKKQEAVVMVPLRCPKCNGQLQPTNTKDVYECKYCGTTVVVKS